MINGSIKNGLLVLAWTTVAVVSLRRLRSVCGELVRWLRHRAGKYLALGCFLYLFGAVFDRLLLEHHEALEELCELGATWLMLLSAIDARNLWRGASSPPEIERDIFAA
ncbi:MAG: hypothetical protein M3032_06795 [Verrucomicrobiota bacterium]|nr:hypothetical protein [Verrucomicrobiota bacterium]